MEDKVLKPCTEIHLGLFPIPGVRCYQSAKGETIPCTPAMPRLYLYSIISQAVKNTND